MFTFCKMIIAAVAFSSALVKNEMDRILYLSAHGRTFINRGNITFAENVHDLSSSFLELPEGEERNENIGKTWVCKHELVPVCLDNLDKKNTCADT